MKTVFIDPFMEKDNVLFEHICDRCGMRFGDTIARFVVDAVVHHICAASWHEDCHSFHATGVNRVQLFRVSAGDLIDFGLRCHAHAVVMYEEAIREQQNGLEIVPVDEVCPMMCADCEVKK